MLESSQEVYFLARDQLSLSAVKPKGKVSTPYGVRLRTLLRPWKEHPAGLVQVIPSRMVRSKAEAYAHCAELIAQGKEGTSVSNPLGEWKDGTSKDKVKLKVEFEVDLEVEAIVPGKAGTKNEGRAGSLTMKSRDGLLRTDATVKNEAMRDSVDAYPEAWIGKIMTVRANNIMLPSESNELHSLFLPRFVEAEVRRDKVVADSLVEVWEQYVAVTKMPTPGHVRELEGQPA